MPRSEVFTGLILVSFNKKNYFQLSTKIRTQFEIAAPKAPYQDLKSVIRMSEITVQWKSNNLNLPKKPLLLQPLSKLLRPV